MKYTMIFNPLKKAVLKSIRKMFFPNEGNEPFCNTITANYQMYMLTKKHLEEGSLSATLKVDDDRFRDTEVF